KNIPMLVANLPSQEGAGFGTDTNVVTLLTREETLELPLLGKEEVADRLLDHILAQKTEAML
ncbi:MAG: phosphopantothenoylcysteine decarboxylase, partial [Lachnospiraceae bacterium]|nr:phosphopantothenoylcysteine decarboxylase [Lachnospiraceae bacterium]